VIGRLTDSTHSPFNFILTTLRVLLCDSDVHKELPYWAIYPPRGRPIMQSAAIWPPGESASSLLGCDADASF